MVMRMGYSDTGEYDEDRNFTYSAKGTYGTSGWMSWKEMAGVLDLVSDLRRHRGVVLGLLDGKAVCVPEETRLNSNLAVYGASGSMKTRSFLHEPDPPGRFTGRIVNHLRPKIGAI